MSRVVVFGGTGFIGSCLCDFFASLGHEVIALGRTKARIRTDKIKFSAINFENPETWKSLLQKDDYVCFLISLNLPNCSEKTDEEKNAVLMMDELLKECISKKIKNFLYLSSGGSIYGNADKAFIETDTPHPVSPYGKLKLAFENLLKKYNSDFKLPVVIARPSNIYGESQGTELSVGVITSFYNRIFKNVPIDIFGDLSICKDYLHVDDLVPTLAKMVLENKSGVYNLGHGSTYSLTEVILMIEKLLNKKAEYRFHPFRATDVHHYSLDCKKARLELDFCPAISLEQGVERYFSIANKS